MAEEGFTFPKDFLWGAATSSHQVEGDNTNNDWWEWEKRGKVREASGQACDHWNRFREDFKLAKSLHHNAHRFSLEWSRIEPEEGQFSEAAIAHYQEVLESLKANGLEPIVSLNHFSLPLWFSKKGGWTCKESPKLFERFAKIAAQSFGKSVRLWMTLNEPAIYVYKSYLIGEWPPGERSFRKTSRVMANLLRAHVLAYDAIKKTAESSGLKDTQVGIANSVMVFAPCSKSSRLDKICVWLRNILFNHLFVRALMRGMIFYPGVFHIRLAKAKTLDFIGLNYYLREFVHNQGLFGPNFFGESCPPEHHHSPGKRNSLSWEIYPEGLYHLAKEFSKYRLPLLISENGICCEHDEGRFEFIRSHLAQLAQAMREEVPVLGYIYWSLLDNFEWAEGFAPRFGLVKVDYATQERKIQPSALKFAEICKTGKIC